MCGSKSPRHIIANSHKQLDGDKKKSGSLLVDVAISIAGVFVFLWFVLSGVSKGSKD